MPGLFCFRQRIVWISSYTFNKNKGINMILTKQNILDFEKFYRATLINSISGFKSANLIGTISSEGKTNLAIFNSVIHVGANPPALGFLMRPVSIERHTYNNIKETGSFTINHINKEIYKLAHQTSASYKKEISEFVATGLTPEYTKTLAAPYVKESKIKMGLKFVEEQEVKLNGTIFIVGEILEIVLPENMVGKDGFVDIEKGGTVAISGLDSYHETKRMTRLSYAKPDVLAKDII
jgi:flavin reductase (DIM6/NTAB) family NADH-FMN oxidoreductase RutF